MPKKRCCEKEGCGKKLELTAFPCKCQKLYCALHRYQDEHDCSYNYQAAAKDELLKTMSTAVVAQKLQVI
jgi:hypothetical protein